MMKKTRKSNPLNMEKKTIVVIDDDGGEIVSGYESHFATCPNAAQHRKREK